MAHIKPAAAMMDWPKCLACAAHLNIAPAQFWALSVREFLALFSMVEAADPRVPLQDLLAAFPD